MMSCAVFLLVFLVTPLVLLVVQTSAWIKWLTLVMSALVYVLALVSALPKGVDIPPVHMMLPFLLWSIAAWRHWFHPNRRRIPQGHCPRCGYNLTGNVSGICPECGEKV